MAENPVSKTHLVAVFVDKNIYKDLESDIKWYASQYIQSRISDSKALVLPIDVNNFAAKDIVAMLENMYFDGVKGASSDLLGAVFLGNIPLPVVQQNGFIYPSIYPYVDFEDQQFIYNANQDYFVYNDNPNGQAEIWHGLIDFDTDIDKYSSFFKKLKTYVKNPSSYVAPRFWYDDVISMKSVFLQDTLPLYVNNFMMIEDVGYHRYTNSMLNYFKTTINESMEDLLQGLGSMTEDVASLLDQGYGTSNTAIPTKMMSTIIKEMMKSYNDLYPGVFLSQVRDNTQAASRWYKKSTDGTLVDAVDSHISKIVLKDSWILSNVGSGVSPLLVNYNNELESALDKMLVSNQWSLSEPVLSTYGYENYSNEKTGKIIKKKYCSTNSNDIYTNYYFGTKVSDIVALDPKIVNGVLNTSGFDNPFSIYRGTFRNISGFDNEYVYESNKSRSSSGFVESLGSSYGIFDTQIEANRGYDLNAAPREADVYSGNKKPLYRQVTCTKWFKIFGWKIFCTRKGFEYVNTDKVESPEQFSLRNWGGASPLNLDTGLLSQEIPEYKLLSYNYKNAQMSIYDMGGATIVTGAKKDAYSVSSITSYPSLIKTQDRSGPLDYPYYVKLKGVSNSEVNYPESIWVPQSDGWRKFNGNKITFPYSDFLSQYEYTNNQGKSNNQIAKTITVGTESISWKSLSTLGGKCGSKFHEYFNYVYRLVSTIVKNVSPTSDQVNGTYESPFIGKGLFKRHYDFFRLELDNFTNEFSAVADGLTYVKKMQNIVNSTYATAQSFKNLSLTGSTVETLLSQLDLVMTGGQQIDFSGAFESLDDATLSFYALPNNEEAVAMIEYMSTYFDDMTEAELLDGKKTQFLQSWIDALLASGSSVKALARSLPTTYSTLSSAYSTLNTTNYGTGFLATKRAEINARQACGTYPSYIGQYASVCEQIDIKIALLNSYAANVASLATQEDEDDNGNKVTYKPFSDLTSSLSITNWFSNLDTLLSTLSGRVEHIKVMPAPLLVPGLNVTTKDRPIDSNRNVTFRGLAGDVVTFYYPNLYEVSVYDNIDGRLVLKTQKAIESAIKLYLINKAKEYNSLLTTQENKRVSYYSKHKSAFDFLSKVSQMATPNRGKTTLLDEKYFISLIQDRIPEIAEMLYYQSLPSYIRTAKSRVGDDMSQIRSSFDVNRKISYVMSGYLTKHDDLGPIVTPSYVTTGYEVAYINSDGNDYLPQTAVPDLISELQKKQFSYSSSTPSNSILQEESAYAKNISACKLGSDYTALLFDIKKGNSPWIDALKCWWKNIPTNTKFSISFSVGPSPKEFWNSLKTMYQDWKSSFKQLSQNTTPVFSGDLAEYWTNITQPVELVDTNTISKVDIVLSSTSSVMAGSQIPFTLLAKDKDGKIITSSVEDYYLEVGTGNGIIVDGINNSHTSIVFNEFDEAWIYQAPKVDKRTSVTLSLYKQDQLISSKQIWVDPAFLTVSSNGNKLYANNSTLRTLQYTIQSGGLLPTLRLQLLTPSGAPLDAAVSFSTKNGLVVPGQLSSDSFVGESSFLIQKGVLDVSLKSLFKAGDDILYVEIPGLDPIEIPLRILAGSPSKIDLSVDKNLLQVGQTLTGSLMVSDAWGNVVSGAKVDIGSLGSLGLSNKTVSVSSQGYSFSSKVLDPGGIGYVFANLVDVAQDEQYPAYQQITVQKAFLPEKDLNVMYLNLFGSDWGNQWAYGSEHKGYVSDLIDNSDKLLAVTTQLIDLNTLKKFTFVVGQNGQIHPFVDLDFSISFSGSNLQIDSDLASVSLVKTKHLTLDSLDQFSDFDQDNIEKPTLYVLQDSLDDTISISSNQLLSGADVLLDLDTGLFGSGISVSMEQDIYQGYNIWNLKSGSNILATLLLVLPSDTLLDSFDIHLNDVSQYATMETFADASTNGLKGVGIYTSDAIFQKEGYVSIEDSSDYKLGVGFTSDFKNITLFGDGQSVGESTVPYGSPFLVNYGDPLLKRISDNIELADIAQDTGIGHQVYSDPSKTIFKVISVDINNDAQKDLVIVFTDGTVKVLKNYGGTHPYRDIGELFRLVGGIQDIQLGDVDNNNYADLIVRTDQNQLRVYTNDRGVFDVDGKLVCLNTNTEQGKISSNPSDVSNTELFFEDMDQDGVLDIVSNDSIGDLKIFYGGISDDGVNYLSTLAYTCDANWYSRQKKSTLLVKRFGLSVDDSLYIQDHSLVHLKGWEISDDANTGIEDEDYGDAELPSDAPTWMASMGSNMSMSSLMSNMTSYFQEQAAVSLTTAFEESPIAEFTPSYESVADHDIVGYKKLLGLSGDKEIAIYKNYQDINGGILLSGDAIKITTTFLGLANGIKASYIDHLLGPWNVPLDKNDRITTWKIEEGTYAVDNVSWGYDDEEIQFVMDNIRLSKGDKLVVSYVVSYQGKPSVSVSIESIKHPKTSKSADQYPDILIKPDDSCKKYRWDFMNTSSNNHRNYDEIFDTSLQDAISSYLGSGSTEGNSLLNNAIPNFSNVSTGAGSESAQNGILDSVSSLLSSSLTEGWSLSSLFTPGSTNISLNMDAVDQALAPMMEKVDKAANALCQGFKLGKGGCQPPAPFNLIPFNQAFLAPGQYHLFGCTPKLPNPLAPVFAYLNKMLGGGMPVLFFPGTFPAGPLQIPMVGSSFLPIVFQSPVSDGFGFNGIYPPRTGIYPSQVRFYLVPTLTLQMGMAICFGPYVAGTKIPKLLRDLGGNCVVTAFPLYTNSCGSSSTTGDNASTEILEPWMTELASQGSCDNLPQLGSTRINYTSSIIKNTVSSPIYMSSRGESNASWTKAIPSGNLWSMATISFNDKPSKVSSTVVSSSPNSVGLSDFSFAGFKFTPGGSINLKVLGPNAKGIIKKFVQDWLSRQTKYIMNNLTKMTLSITLPNVTDLVKGFDTLQADTASDTAFIGSRNISNLTGINKIAGIASQQNYTAASDLVNNPFESLVNLFENVPLVRLQTKDIVVNVPMLTTENILKYSNYLKSWLNQQQKILKKWVEAVGEAINICGDINKSQATQALNDIPSIESLIRQAPLSSFLTQEKKEKAFVAITSYKKLLSDVINGTITKPNLNFAQDAVNSWKNTQGQLGLLAQKARILPALQLSINVLESKKTPSSSEQALLSRLKTNIQELNGCVAFSNNMDVFTNFYANSTSLVKNVQQNIQILEQYRKFPSQLSKWMGAANTYLSDITSFISNTVVVLMQWMNTNAKIYSKYVDALILIISSIKTWQILIDFSVNWNQKCGKCSRDSYGSYNCGLSFLLDKIKLPILPIPPFKIPNIYVDLSHIDLGMTIQLPKFRFVPMNIALPTIPNIPSPPSINISTSMDIDLNFTASLSKVLTIELPNIPILPTPPTLPELPSFIPKVDFALPTLPPAPKIPTLIPEISTTLDFASTLGRIFCITKGSVGLVGEKGVKAKVEQLTQRTWDVKSVDFFNKTVTWKKDPPLYGFDFKLDGYLQFKLDFDAFYGFLNQIVGDVNSFTTTAQSKIQKDLSKLSVDAQKKVTDFTNTNLKDIDFDFNLKTDVNINADILKSAYNETGVDYEIAAAKLKQDLAYFDSQVKDDPVIKQKIKTVRSVISDSFEITPTNKQILAVEKQVKSILSDKQQEIKTLASRIKKYDSFVAQVKTQDAVLVSNDSIDTLYSIPLFSTSDENRKLLASQENPYKLSLDTNAGLVDRYLNTIKNSTPEDLGVTNDIYKKAESYLTTLSDKVDRVYDRLNLQPVAYDSCGVPTIVDTKQTGSPLLAANTTTTTTTAMSDDTAYDLSSYVSGIFVPKTTTTGTQMINVVKSDAYIEKIGDNYKVFAGDKTTDLNKDGLVDVLSWDTHTVYIKYSQQHAVPKKDLSKQSYDSTYYLYDGGSWYISSYNGLLETFYPDGDGYVSFGKVDIKLVKPYPEIKNFIVSGQEFDSVQFSWTSHSALGYYPDGYLVKLNQRIDTFADKDKNFNLGLSQDLLAKSYVLFLPKDTEYTDATIDFGEISYDAKGKSFSQEKLISQLLPGGQHSGALLTIKYYDPEDDSISSSLSEIPRHWQYAKVAALKNLGNQYEQKYVLGSVWSNQIVLGKQLLADTVGPSSSISLYRPTIKAVVSEGNDHKGYVGTNYTLQAYWQDNLSVSKMWISKNDTIIALKTGYQATGFIELSGLYFTGSNTLDLVFGAQDSQGNIQTDPVRLFIDIPELSVTDVSLTGNSGQIVAELSHDIDEGLVSFQRERNNRRQVITGTQSNILGGFPVKPLQTIVTGSTFSFSQNVGFYDTLNRQIGSLSPDGNMTILSQYADRYQIVLDITSTLPSLRVLDKKDSDTLFWVHLPPKKLVSMELGQRNSLYKSIPLKGSSFGAFNGGTCIQNSTQECIVYVSPLGEIYIPQQFVNSLKGSYFYNTTDKVVVYTLRDSLASDIDPYIVQFMLQVNIF